MTDWRDEARCAGDRESLPLFFSPNRDDQKKAAEICAQCPVRLQCLQAALDNNEVHGVWGGATQEELRRDQSLDSAGQPHIHANKRIRCPYCGPHSTKNLEIVLKKRTKTQIKCMVCGLTWWTRKIIGKSRNF